MTMNIIQSAKYILLLACAILTDCSPLCDIISLCADGSGQRVQNNTRKQYVVYGKNHYNSGSCWESEHCRLYPQCISGAMAKDYNEMKERWLDEVNRNYNNCIASHWNQRQQYCEIEGCGEFRISPEESWPAVSYYRDQSSSATGNRYRLLKRLYNFIQKTFGHS